MIFVAIRKLRGDSDLTREDYVICTLLEGKESKTLREGEKKETGYGGRIRLCICNLFRPGTDSGGRLSRARSGSAGIDPDGINC
jgi:hypothetical protein